MSSHGKSASVAVMVSSDALIRSISPDAEKITGYSAGDLVGRPITQILTDHSLFEMPQILRTARETGVWEGNLAHRDRNGNTVNAHASLTSLRGPKDTDFGYFLLSVPASGSTASGCEEAILGDVAARLRNITHELNNPLAVMMGFAQLMLLGDLCDDKMRVDVERLLSEMRRLIQVVEKLHAYAVSLQNRAKLQQIDKAS